MSTEEMKMSAANFGFDAGWIADILQQYGADALALAIEAARNGFSIAFVVEVLQKFGPCILKFIFDLFSSHQSAMRMRGMTGTGDVVTGDLIEGVNGAFIDVIVEKYLPVILEKYLPQIVEQFGPILLKLIQENLGTLFDKFGPQIIQMVLQLILGNLKAAK